VVYALAVPLLSRWSGLKRLLSSPRRRQAQLQRAARSCFVERRVSGTRSRTGLLLYLGAFERASCFIPDLGIEAQVPKALFNDLELKISKAKTTQEFQKAVLGGLESLQEPLSRSLPRAEDDENELSDEIYIQGSGAS
jgi:putative membrane protein